MRRPLPRRPPGLGWPVKLTAPAGDAGLPRTGTALARVVTDRPAAVLLVELASRRIVHANVLAQQLAPGLLLPIAVDVWSDAAGLRDPRGQELSGTEHPLSLAARGVAAPGGAISARRASSATAPREALFAVGLPLDGPSGLDGHMLVVLLPLHPGSTLDATGQQRLQEQAVLAAGCSFSLASATEPDLPLTWVNPAFTATTGYPAEEAVGRNCRFLQGSDTDQHQVAVLRDALHAGQDATVVMLNYRKDGTAFWNQIAISPILNGAGTVTHFVGVQTDVTERVEAERVSELVLATERTARAEAETARAEAEAARADADGARHYAEVLGGRLALMAEASGLLAATLDLDESLERLARLVVPLLADWVVINVTDDQGRLGSDTFVRHRDGREDLLGRYRELVPAGVAPGSPLHDLLAGGPPTLMARFVAPPEADLPESEREIRRISVELGASSLAFVPLTARRRVVGTMMLVQGASGRQFDEGDLDLAADLGRRAGLAVDNARLYTAEHTNAVALQRSLLPALPAVAGLVLAAEYLPAGKDSQVGGDWWDVFALPDGAIGLAVGDVMGHDIAAAAAMGQLRSVLRTCAWAGDGPATVLDRMDQLVQGFDMAELATCFYARLEPGCQPEVPGRLRRLSWSNAGHLPPVLLKPNGEASLLQGVGDVPIGVPSSGLRRHDALTVVPGSTLLLYTDGLVETRTGDIDSDLQRLLNQVAAHRPTDGPLALVDRLIEGLTGLTDDVAVLAVQTL